MAKFYQPKETQGIYEAGPNRLTVNQDDRVLIGFRAASTKELQGTTVDTSENVVTARYSINPTTIELEIETSKPLVGDVANYDNFHGSEFDPSPAWGAWIIPPRQDCSRGDCLS